MKRNTCLLMILMLCVLCLTASAEAPTSQFGFRGWPYRQSTPCQPANGASNDSDAALIEQCKATACPVRDEQSAPAASPLPVPTIRPTQAPTARPTQAPTAKPTARPSSSTGDYTTTSAAMQEQKLWNLLNQDRAQNGLSALPLDSRLSELARLKACDMKQNHYFAHTSPTYGSAAQMLTSFGYAFRGVGENIAHHATVEKSEAAFMSSAGHRQNILGSQWTKVGVGVCFDDQGFVYVTQLFAR